MQNEVRNEVRNEPRKPLWQMAQDEVWEAIRWVSQQALALRQLRQRFPGMIDDGSVALLQSRFDNELAMLRAELKRRKELAQ